MCKNFAYVGKTGQKTVQLVAEKQGAVK